MENRTWYLFSKKLSGEASLAEISELNNLLSQHPHLHQDLEAFEQYWNTPALIAETNDHNEAFEKLMARMKAQDIDFAGHVQVAGWEAPAVPFYFRKSTWIAAVSVAAVLALAFWFWPQTQASQTIASPVAELAQNNQVSTRPGSRTKIVLPDGTQVWLNADSKLTYGNDFGHTSRDVRLSGEAYFDVVSNKKVPFHILTDKIKIKVTGTAFNVRAYPNEAKSETSLLRGRVEVTVNSQPDKTYYLKPSEKLVVLNDAPLLTTTEIPKSTDPRLIMSKEKVLEPVKMKIALDEKDQTPVDIAWVYNRLAFNNEPFRAIADKMEKWYGVEIIFLTPRLEDEPLTGSFIDETVQEALEYLQLACKFTYTVKGNQIMIK